MKKSLIIKISLPVIIVLIILSLVAILQPKPAPIPTFNFLSGRALAAQYKVESSFFSETRFVYSFEADSSAVFADANSELSNLGYINNSSNTAGDDPHIVFYLPGVSRGDSITIRVIKNNKMNIYETPKNSDYKTPNKYEYSWKEGWVSVEIIQKKQYSWLKGMIKSILNKIRRSE